MEHDIGRIKMKKQSRAMLAIDVMGIAISRAVFLGMNPIAMGFFGAAYFIKRGRFFTFLMVCLGMASALTVTDLIKYIIIMAVCGIIVGLIESKVKQANIYVIGATVGSATTIISCSTAFYYNQVKEQLFFCAMEGLIAFTFVLLFSKGINWMMQCKRNCIPDNEQLISISLLAGSIIYGLGNLEVKNISISIAITFLFIIFIAYKYGAGFGAVIGTVCGIAVSSINNDYTMIGFLCIFGIAIGLFRELGRLITAVVYIVGVVCLGLYQNKLFVTIDGIRAMLAAGTVFLLLPHRLVRRIDISGGNQGSESEFAKESVESITKHKLQEFSSSFYHLSKTYREITQKKVHTGHANVIEMMDDLSSQICVKCERCDLCWKNEYNNTYQDFQSFLTVIEETGTVERKQLSSDFNKRCLHVSQIVNEGIRMGETAKLNSEWQNRLAESREAIAGQLDEVATIIDEFSNDLYRISGLSQQSEYKLKAVLKANRVIVKHLVILEKRDNRKQVYMIARAGKGQCITSREVAGIIGGVLELSMRPADSTKNVISKNYDTFAFVEDTIFKTLTGSARITKLGEKISGDSFSILSLENGQMILSISDGMGTGVNANEESESVIELLEQFMEAGFKEESAIRLINSILVLKSENQSFSTIDLSVLNLYTGVCEFVKIGAATTFIKRENWVETISSTTMPVGVFNQVDFDQKSKKLYDGDYIIMMSDGVLDCIEGKNKEKYMQEIILNLSVTSPQEMANTILREALAQNEDVPLDDMTVLVAGIWKK